MDQPTLYFGNNYKEQINRGGDSFITFVFLISLIFYLKPNSTLRFGKKIWNHINSHWIKPQTFIGYLTSRRAIFKIPSPFYKFKMAGYILFFLFQGDWSRAATTKPVLTPIAIDKWAIVVNETNCFQALSNLKQGLETSAKKLGITLKSPKIIKISDDRSETVVKAIREMPSGCEFLVSNTFFYCENAHMSVEKLCEFD